MLFIKLSILQSSPGLKFVHINCRSLFKNLDQVIENFKHCDVVCCTETWLKPELSTSLLYFPGKRIFRLDRNLNNGKMRGGGVCIFVCERLSSFAEIEVTSTSTVKDFEILTLKITKPNMRHMLISCIYKPPTGKTDKVIEFLNRIYENTQREVWLLGDFNVDFLD